MKNKKLIITALMIICLGCNTAFADFKEHFDLAQNYLSQYQYSSAITEFKNALSINYMDVSARVGLVNAYLARGRSYAINDKNWEKAANDYRNALFYLEYYPNNQDAINNSANITAQVTSNLEKCLNAINYDRSPQNRYNTATKLRAIPNFGAAAYEFAQSLGDKSLQKSSFEQIGEILETLDNKPKAAEYYKKAVAIAPSDLNLRLTYAKTLDNIKNYDLAIKEYSYILAKSTSDDKEILYTLERIFSKKLEQEPKNASFNANMGAILQKEGKFNEALGYYQQAEELDPTNLDTRINVGTLYQQKGDYKTAIKAYDTVLTLEPNNVKANLYKAQCNEKLGEDKLAHEGYKKVLTIDPENQIIKNQMLETVKKTMNIQQFVDYVKTNYSSNNPEDIIYDYAIELHKANKTDDAIYLYNEVLKMSPSIDIQAQIYVNMALAQTQGKNFDEAISILNMAKEKFPTNVSIKENLKNIENMKTDNQMNIAYDFYNEKKYDKAIEAYMAVTPVSANSMLGVASSYQELGDTQKAIEYYKKALELKPLDSDIAYYIAALYGQHEDWENAKNYLSKSIAFNKNNKQAIEYLNSIEEMEKSNLLNNAISKYEENNYEESLKDLNTLLGQDGKNAYALYYRGMIYDSMEKHFEAIKDFKNAYAINKEFTICPYMIATNYDALKKYKEAIEYYDLYANSNVEDDDYKKYAKDRAQELRDSSVNTTAAK